MRVGTWTILCGIAAASWSTPGQAYCRSTTCDPERVACDVDEHGCSLEGAPIYWERRCLQVWFDPLGSTKREISGNEVETALSTAFEAWTGTTCDGKSPSIDVRVAGAAERQAPGYDKDDPDSNINLVMFREEDWPYRSPIALTTVTFRKSTGEILDADIEINSYLRAITTDDDEPINDLQSVLTHEAGHFLGFAHSDDPEALMFAEYTPSDLSRRELGSDDQIAMCEVHIPSGNECSDKDFEASPLSNAGSCRISPRLGPIGMCFAPLAPTTLFLLLHRRRRRSKRNQAPTPDPSPEPRL